jgi:hypothetical protein
MMNLVFPLSKIIIRLHLLKTNLASVPIQKSCVSLTVIESFEEKGFILPSSFLYHFLSVIYGARTFFPVVIRNCLLSKRTKVAASFLFLLSQVFTSRAKKKKLNRFLKLMASGL